MSRIEQLIGEIEEYLDSCKAQAFSNSKRIVVEKDVIDEMLVELRMCTPDEIKKYQKVIASRDSILEDAQSRADAILEDANRQLERKVNEHEILAQAQEQAQALYEQAEDQAQAIIDKAVADANAIRESAIQYTDEQLATVQNIVTGAMESTQNRYTSFMNQLQSSLDVIVGNREQLSPSQEPSSEPEVTITPEPEDDYHIDIALDSDK